MLYQINISDTTESAKLAFIREGERSVYFGKQAERKTQVHQLDPQSRREYVEFLRLRYASGAMEVDCDAVASRLLTVLVSAPAAAEGVRPGRTSFGLPA